MIFGTHIHVPLSKNSGGPLTLKGDQLNKLFLSWIPSSLANTTSTSHNLTLLLCLVSLCWVISEKVLFIVWAWFQHVSSLKVGLMWSFYYDYISFGAGLRGEIVLLNLTLTVLSISSFTWVSQNCAEVAISHVACLDLASGIWGLKLQPLHWCT